MLAVIFLTQISWGSIGLCGVLFVSQNNLRFRTLEAIVPATHLLKITSPMLITYYSISVILSSLRKRKAYTWEVAEARMRLQQQFDEYSNYDSNGQARMFAKRLVTLRHVFLLTD